MHFFSSNHSLSGSSSNDTKPMFMGGGGGGFGGGGRREPLIPSTYHTQHRIHHQTMGTMPLISGHHTTTLQSHSTHHHQQPPPPSLPPPPLPSQPPPPPPSSIPQTQTTLGGYPCVHPHHSMLGSPCSPSISSNSINIWTTIGNATLKNHDKMPQYSGVATLSRMKTIELEHRKRSTWRSRKSLWFLILGIACVLTLVLLLFSLIFYLLVFQKSSVTSATSAVATTTSVNGQQSHSSGPASAIINSGNGPPSSTFVIDPSNLNDPVPSLSSVSSLPSVPGHHHSHLSASQANEQLFSLINDKTRVVGSQSSNSKRRRKATRKLDCEFVVLNRAYRPDNRTHEVALIHQSIDYFLRRNLHLCLNRSEITQYRRSANPGRLGVLVNFELQFDCAMANAGKRLAFFFKNFYKDELAIDFRTLRMTPVYDANSEYVDVEPSEDGFLVRPDVVGSGGNNGGAGGPFEWAAWSNWTECDCLAQVLVRSRSRGCLDHSTGKVLSSYFCSGSFDVDGEHGYSLEIKDCECPPAQSTSAPIYDRQLSVCGKCDRHREICLAYGEGPPSCVTIKTAEEPCGGHCNLKSEECKYDASARLHRCVSGGNACFEEEFRCSNGLCIPKAKQCDGHFNCYDSSDEMNCACDIASGEYMHCGNGTSCIHISKRCNDIDDCWDHSDESDCFNNCVEPSIEKGIQFQCQSKGKECIDMTKYCDGHRDCFDGSDETECDPPAAGRRPFSR